MDGLPSRLGRPGGSNPNPHGSARRPQSAYRTRVWGHASTRAERLRWGGHSQARHAATRPARGRCRSARPLPPRYGASPASGWRGAFLGEQCCAHPYGGDDRGRQLPRARCGGRGVTRARRAGTSPCQGTTTTSGSRASCSASVGHKWPAGVTNRAFRRLGPRRPPGFPVRSQSRPGRPPGCCAWSEAVPVPVPPWRVHQVQPSATFFVSNGAVVVEAATACRWLHPVHPPHKPKGPRSGLTADAQSGIVLMVLL
jgi:hypothetical protein